jgi:uncharacterized membrane protein
MLLLVIITGGALRFYRLNFQSLWYDELYTMNEADPALPLKDFFAIYLKDEHPPFFFMLERIMFSIFGYEEHIARILPAIAGTLSIYAIYLLGKELLDRRVGLVAAMLMAVNWFGLYFSQEARAYTLLGLFTIFSFLYFLRILKHFKNRDIILYGVSTALMLYCHYFSLFTVFSQLVLVVIFWVKEREQKRKLALSFFKGMLLALILYLPCFPFLMATANIEKYWTPLLPPTFVLNYYADFFGAYRPLYPLLFGLPIVYFVSVYKNRSQGTIRSNPLLAGFFIIGVTLILSFGLPYLRAVLITPALQNRYFFSTVPLFILMQALAIVSIKNRTIGNSILIIFIGLMVYNQFVIRQYYTLPMKEDMRSLTTYIAEKGPHYDMVNEKSSWNQSFYLKKKGYTGKLIRGNMNSTIDSIVQGTIKTPMTDTLWLEGGYTDHAADSATMKKFEQQYFKVSEQHFHQAWAQLWVKKNDLP